MTNKVKRQKVRIRWDCYLSGALSSCGKFDANVLMFADGTRQLRERGFRTFSPPENEPRDWSWVEYLKSDIVALVSCKMLVLLPNWKCSKGARLERTIALRLGMPVVTLEEALAMRPR